MRSENVQKFKTINQLIETGVIGVVRAETSKQGMEIAKACLAGGIDTIELTFTVPNADQVIGKLTEQFGSEMVIGAGTVLDSATARIAILAGASFIVSPGFSLETAKLCNRYQVPYIAGCMTITEMTTAMEAGVDIIKLFPSPVFGPEFIELIKGPLPHANIMPTGGINLDNIDQWIKSGCLLVGASSDLTAPAKTGDYAGVTALAKKFVTKVKEARAEL